MARWPNAAACLCILVEGVSQLWGVTPHCRRLARRSAREFAWPGASWRWWTSQRRAMCCCFGYDSFLLFLLCMLRTPTTWRRHQALRGLTAALCRQIRTTAPRHLPRTASTHPVMVHRGPPLPLMNSSAPTLLAIAAAAVPMVYVLPPAGALWAANWLEQGGVFVLNCIRGSGEFGPVGCGRRWPKRRQSGVDNFLAICP